MRKTTQFSLNRAGPLAACLALAAAGLTISQANAALVAQNRYGGDTIRVLVNGDTVHFRNNGPRTVGGRLLVPLRGVLEMTGANVQWDPRTQTVMATRGDMRLELVIGSRNARVNGRDVLLDVPAMTLSGYTMVPLRFVGESLGGEVTWDNRTQTVSINTSESSYNNYGDRRDGNMNRTRNPRVYSVTHNNLFNNTLASGQQFNIVMHGTPGGQAWFRIRGSVAEMKMHETSNGVYEGSWRNNSSHGVRLDDHDILAFIVVNNASSPETMPNDMNRR